MRLSYSTEAENSGGLNVPPNKLIKYLCLHTFISMKSNSMRCVPKMSKEIDKML